MCMKLKGQDSRQSAAAEGLVYTENAPSLGICSSLKINETRGETGMMLRGGKE